MLGSCPKALKSLSFSIRVAIVKESRITCDGDDQHGASWFYCAQSFALDFMAWRNYRVIPVQETMLNGSVLSNHSSLIFFKSSGSVAQVARDPAKTQPSTLDNGWRHFHKVSTK